MGGTGVHCGWQVVCVAAALLPLDHCRFLLWLQVPCMRHRPACPALLASRAAQKLVPTIVPGIILGVLCLLGFTFFSLWS